jgi:hypothetical protein
MYLLIIVAKYKKKGKITLRGKEMEQRMKLFIPVNSSLESWHVCLV